MHIELRGDVSLAQGYESHSQQARLISEGWITKYGYCLNCDSDKLLPTTANTRTRDFRCGKCEHAYELKSKQGAFSRQVLDGAYSAMMKTIREGNTPTFLLLEYTSTWSIAGLRAIHHSLITEKTIKARNSLSDRAKRAGWIGCSIVLPSIAIEGQIPIVKHGAFQSKELSRQSFGRLEKLSSLSAYSRSWAGTLLQMLHTLPHSTFTLSEVYEFAPKLEKLYPRNKHVKEKIRQQLQVLRDAGLISFSSRGVYELTSR